MQDDWNDGGKKEIDILPQSLSLGGGEGVEWGQQGRNKRRETPYG